MIGLCSYKCFNLEMKILSLEFNKVTYGFCVFNIKYYNKIPFFFLQITNCTKVINSHFENTYFCNKKKIFFYNSFTNKRKILQTELSPLFYLYR